MNSANPEREQRQLWPTTLGVYRWPQAEAANEVLDVYRDTPLNVISVCGPLRIGALLAI
jgi:hypothetical protein